MLSQAGAAALVNTPFFAALLSIPTDGSLRNLTPQRQRELTIAALIRQIRDLALMRPVVFELEDAHWADASTLELLDRCIASIKTARVFTVCTFRSEFLPHWLDEPHVTRLRLDRLSPEQTGLIISDVAGGKELPSGLRERIVSKVDGVPLFAEELTKAVLDSGLLPDASERYVTNGSLLSLNIPMTLLSPLAARLDRLAGQTIRPPAR